MRPDSKSCYERQKRYLAKPENRERVNAKKRAKRNLKSPTESYLRELKAAREYRNKRYVPTGEKPPEEIKPYSIIQRKHRRNRALRAMFKILMPIVERRNIKTEVEFSPHHGRNVRFKQDQLHEQVVENNALCDELRNSVSLAMSVLLEPPTDKTIYTVMSLFDPRFSLPKYEKLTPFRARKIRVRPMPPKPEPTPEVEETRVRPRKVVRPLEMVPTPQLTILAVAAQEFDMASTMTDRALAAYRQALHRAIDKVLDIQDDKRKSRTSSRSIIHSGRRMLYKQLKLDYEEFKRIGTNVAA